MIQMAEFATILPETKKLTSKIRLATLSPVHELLSAKSFLEIGNFQFAFLRLHLIYRIYNLA